MNTKDNQEAEPTRYLKITELEFLEFAEKEELFLFADKEDLIAVFGGVMELVNSKLAKAPTPKVNEEVASGEVVAYLRRQKMTDYAISLLPMRLQREAAKEKGWSDWEPVSLSIYESYQRSIGKSDWMHDEEFMPLYLHPPTPSPSNVLVEALQRDNSELKDFIAKAFLAHPNLDLDIEALATYSASTDSVSVPIDDRARLEHIFKTNPTIYLAHNFDSWIEAIDTARKSS